jgi:hypothetical protein
LNGSQSLVGKATAILKQDIDALPYPEAAGSLALSFWEAAFRDDVLEYMMEYVRLGQSSRLLRSAVGKTDLQVYADTFCRMLGSVYKNLRSHEPLHLDTLICQPFYFGSKPQVPWLTKGADERLHELVYQLKHETLRTVRVIRFYDGNVLALVKPDRLRYWIRSTAIRDADETLTDLYLQGY